MAFVLKKTAKPGATLVAGRSLLPAAPGAVSSPQIPGQVPDRSSIWGEGDLPVPPVTGEVRRPRAEDGTSQRIMGVFVAKNGNENDPARFEQAPPSYEEQRKGNPALRTPLRPMPGYALADGTRVSGPEVAALAAGAPTVVDPD